MNIRNYNLFSLIILTLYFHSNIYANEFKSYKDEYVTFEYPAEYKVTTNLDEDGYKEIYIDGPKGILITISVMPEAIPVGLKEFEEVIHSELIKEYKDFDISNRVIKYVTGKISGKTLQGVSTTYTITRLYIIRRSKTFTHYILSNSKNTFVVTQEIEPRYKDLYGRHVSDILGSIKFSGV
jgi:hypothetical protein